MTSLSIIWMLSTAMGLVLTIVAAAMNAYGLHFGLALVVSGLIAIMAIRERKSAIAQRLAPRTIVALSARYMGFLWAWAAANLFLVYGTLISWAKAGIVVTMLVVAAAICLFVASVIERNLEARSVDDGFERFVGLIAKANLGIACALFGCLLAAGQLSPTELGGETKWVALNVLMTTAMAMAMLSAHAIVTEDRRALTTAN